MPRETQGYEVVRTEEKLGLHASDTCQIALTNVRVPNTLMLGQQGEGLKIALSNLEGAVLELPRKLLDWHVLHLKKRPGMLKNALPLASLFLNIRLLHFV